MNPLNHSLAWDGQKIDYCYNYLDMFIILPSLGLGDGILEDTEIA